MSGRVGERLCPLFEAEAYGYLDMVFLSKIYETQQYNREAPAVFHPFFLQILRCHDMIKEKAGK